MQRRVSRSDQTPAAPAPEPSNDAPTAWSPAPNAHPLRWQVYAFVGAALLFAPIYGVMKAYETYVDVPACERKCLAIGYRFESLVTGKNRYDCNCLTPTGRQTFHERANLGGGTSLFSSISNWFVRCATALAAVVVSVLLVVKLVRLTEASTGGVAAPKAPENVKNKSRRHRRSRRRESR